jgi:hypothetical protein
VQKGDISSLYEHVHLSNPGEGEWAECMPSQNCPCLRDRESPRTPSDRQTTTQTDSANFPFYHAVRVLTDGFRTVLSFMSAAAVCGMSSGEPRPGSAEFVLRRALSHIDALQRAMQTCLQDDGDPTAGGA